MDIFLITFQAVAALLGIGVLGFWIIGRRRIPANALGLLTSIAIDIALPCLVLANILTQFNPANYPGWWQMPLYWLGFTLVSLGLGSLTSFLVKREFRGEFVISLLFQNGIFFPLIIITGMFDHPQSYLVIVFLFVFLQPSVVFSAYPLFFGRKVTAPAFNWKRVINPVLVMTLIGLVIGLLGINAHIPDFITMILSMVGAMSVPLFMLILGGNVYHDFMYKDKDKEKTKIYTGEVIKFTLVKNLLYPLVALGILIWLRPEYPVAFVLFLQAAVPPITAIPILAERCGGNRIISNQFIVASFLFSIISIPAALTLFNLFFTFPGR